MTQSDVEVAEDDRFGLWYRFRTLVVFNLLYVAGPAQLDTHLDPRSAVEQEYERRRDLHRARLGKAPVVRTAGARDDGIDPVVLCAVGGVLAVVLLVVWAVLAR